jgi:hypothetical protein
LGVSGPLGTFILPVGSYQSDGRCPPSLVPVLHWVPLCVQGPQPDSHGGGIPLVHQTVRWHLLGSLRLVVQGTHPSNKKTPTISAILAVSPQEMLWETRAETPHTKARKQCFLVLAQTQWIHVQRLSPKNKRV